MANLFSSLFPKKIDEDLLDHELKEASQLTGLDVRIRALDNDILSYFDAIEVSDHDMVCDEHNLKRFIDTLTIVIGEISLKLKEIGDTKAGLSLPGSKNLVSLSNFLKSYKKDLAGIKGFDDELDYFDKTIAYLQNVSDLSAMPGKVTQALGKSTNDILSISIQIKELKSLFADDEKWLLDEDAIITDSLSLLQNVDIDEYPSLVQRSNFVKASSDLTKGEYKETFPDVVTVNASLSKLLTKINAVKKDESTIGEIHHHLDELNKSINKAIVSIYNFYADIKAQSMIIEAEISRLEPLAGTSVPFDGDRLKRYIDSVMKYFTTNHIKAYVFDEDSLAETLDDFKQSVEDNKDDWKSDISQIRDILDKINKDFEILNNLINVDKTIMQISSKEADILDKIAAETKQIEDTVKSENVKDIVQ